MTDMPYMRRTKNNAQHYGHPGRSSSLGKRSYLAALPWKTKLILTSVLVIAGALIGLTGGITPTPLPGAFLGGMTGLGIAILLWAIVLIPRILINGLIILITITLLPFLGGAYTLPAAGFPDYLGGTVALFVVYAIGLWIVARIGKYRSVINVGVLSSSLLFPGLILLEVFPNFGLNNARISVLLVTIILCGGVSWLREGMFLLFTKITQRNKEGEDYLSYEDADPGSISSAWKRREHAEKETAQVLAQLPNGIFIFHDVNIPKTGITMGHVIVNNEGVLLIASVAPTGIPYQDPTQGLLIPGVDVNDIAWKLYQAKIGASKSLKINTKYIRTIINVVGDEAVFIEPTTFAMYGEDNYREPLAKILIVNTGKLLEEVSPNFPIWSAVKTQNIARRIRMKFSPAIMPETIYWEDNASPMKISYINEDGQETLSYFYPKSSADYAYRIGQEIEVLTSQGYVTGLIIAGEPYHNDEGELVVKVKETPERAAFTSRRTYRTYLFPVSSIRPATSIPHG